MLNYSFDTFRNGNGNYLKSINPSLSSSNKIINNYGVKVDDTVLFRKMLQNKYREDLDDLIRQKKSESQNIKNQEGEDANKFQRMNDKYNLEKRTQQALFREYNIYNEKEAEEKKQKMKELRENQYKEYLEKLNSINTEKEITKMINQDKKEQLRRQIEKDLVDYRRKKFNERQKEKQETQNYISFNKSNDAFYDIEKDYRSKISKMNNNIYNNALIYNDYLNEGKNNNIFKIKNDLLFNQKVAEIKQKEKQETMIQNINNIKIQKQKNNIQNMLEQEIKEQKLLEKQNYRNFLEKQKIEQKNNNNNNNILVNSGEQLLMPSYRYSNVPKYLINYTLNRSASVNRNLNIDTPKKKFYLGDSTLEHNPITFPVEDTTNKKYILSQIYRQQLLNKNNSMNTDNHLSFLSSDFGNNNNLLKDNKNDINSS
jgi:hypothetical protein